MFDLLLDIFADALATGARPERGISVVHEETVVPASLERTLEFFSDAAKSRSSRRIFEYRKRALKDLFKATGETQGNTEETLTKATGERAAEGTRPQKTHRRHAEGTQPQKTHRRHTEDRPPRQNVEETRPQKAQ